MAEIPLSSQSYTDAVGENSADELINLYPEAGQGRFPFVLVGCAGLKLFGTVGVGPHRGSIRMDGIKYTVSGNEFYSVNSSGVGTLVGTVTGTGPVSMAENGTQIAIAVPGSKGYIATATTISQITDPNFITPNTVTFLDGFFVWSIENGQAIISKLNDGTAYDALDFFTAETDPDDIVTVISDHQELVLLGTDTIDFYRNTGAPFSRMGGSTAEKGCLARFSVQKADNSVIWLAPDFTVYRLNGRTPLRISSHAVETAIKSYAQPENAESFVYGERGSLFYVLKFDEETWVYSFPVDRWFKRRSKGRDNWRVGSYCFAYDKHLVGDELNGKIYEIDPSTFDEDGDEITRITDLPYVDKDNLTVFSHRLEVIFGPGVGLTVGQGSDPQIMMSYSDNGGKTYSTELRRTAGKIGVYDTRATWNRMGSFRRRTHRFLMSDPVEWRILGVLMEASLGSS